MLISELSEEQKEILRPGSVAVEACPGSGKTRAVLSRFKHSADTSRRGVALLAFTNKSVQEARHRCKDFPQLLRSPNFIGTFDLFLHRYIVSPYVIREKEIVPTYVRDWSALPFQEPEIRVSQGSGISLSSFVWTADGLEVMPRGIQETLYLDSVMKSNRLRALLQSAKNKIHNLENEGIYDSGLARLRAREILKNSHSNELLSRLSKRFCEVIVDEFQDCDELEHEILGSLSSTGINVVVVADPDQAIYEFRGAAPSRYTRYIELNHADSKISFTINFRSSPAICAIASSLRVLSDKPIKAQDYPSIAAKHIYLIPGSVENQRESFLHLLADQSSPIAISEAVALAHKWSTARQLSGVDSGGSSSRAKGNQVYRQILVLNNREAPVRNRVEALHELEELLLSAFDWPHELRGKPRSQKLGALGKSEEWLRVCAARVIRSSSTCTNATDAGRTLRATLSSNLGGIAIQLVRLDSYFKKPDDSTWQAVQNSLGANPRSIPYETIHQSKGTEREAVLLAIPETPSGAVSVLDDWEQGRNSEARRVLYVGATRAKSLLALAVPPSSVTQLERILKRDNVPFEIIRSRCQTAGPTDSKASGST